MARKGLAALLSMQVALLASGLDMKDLYKETFTGVAMYDDTSPVANGFCRLGPPSPAGVPNMPGVTAVAAVSSTLYQGLYMCGICIKVTGEDGKSTIAYINDECKACGSTDIGMYVAGKNQQVTWKAVPCPVANEPIKYWFDASNVNWLRIKAVGPSCPLIGMFVDVGGKWKEGKHTADDFWEFGGSDVYRFPINVAVTNLNGETLTDVIPAITTGATPGAKRIQFQQC